MIKIIGAGMAGLLAGRIFAGMGEKVIIFEKQPALPNNHHAVLRFRSPLVGDVLNIPFAKVKVMKSYAPWRNPIADNLAYARKCTAVNRVDRSITSAGMEMNERWIAPPDLIERMAKGLSIEYGVDFNCITGSFTKEPTISTIPMPLLMRDLEYPGTNPEVFGLVHGWTITQKLKDVSAYASLYVPNPRYDFNRVSLSDDKMIIEFACPNRNSEDIQEIISHTDTWHQIERAMDLLGLEPSHVAGTGEPEVKLQKYAKILPVPDQLRKSFMFWATDQCNVFSLGRFATWRPGLLLDDLVQDIRLIAKMMGDRYSIGQLRSAAK